MRKSFGHMYQSEYFTCLERFNLDDKRIKEIKNNISTEWVTIKKILKEEVSLYLYGMENRMRPCTKKRAFSFGNFTLTDKSISPYYFDLGTAYAYPKVFRRLSELIVEIIEYEILECPTKLKSVYGNKLGTIKIERLAGIPPLIGISPAGLGLATLASQMLELPLLYSDEKGKIFGSLEEGDHVIMVSDVITSGKTKMKNIDFIRNAGAKVEHAVVLIDREEGGKELLEQNSVTLHCLIKCREIVSFLKSLGLLTNEEKERVMRYINKRRKKKGLE